MEFAAHLVKDIGIACVPGSSFYKHAKDGAQQVRFAFCKKPETLDEAGRGWRNYLDDDKSPKRHRTRFASSLSRNPFGHDSPPIHSNLSYTRVKASKSLTESESCMSAKGIEEVSAQVPAEDFQALEEKVYRTIELYKAAKEARAHAERDAERLREQLEQREEENQALRRELVQLRKDREDIRGRVERMLNQMESLGQEQAAS